MNYKGSDKKNSNCRADRHFELWRTLKLTHNIMLKEIRKYKLNLISNLKNTLIDICYCLPIILLTSWQYFGYEA